MEMASNIGWRNGNDKWLLVAIARIIGTEVSSLFPKGVYITLKARVIVTGSKFDGRYSSGTTLTVMVCHPQIAAAPLYSRCRYAHNPLLAPHSATSHSAAHIHAPSVRISHYTAAVPSAQSVRAMSNGRIRPCLQHGRSACPRLRPAHGKWK